MFLTFVPDRLHEHLTVLSLFLFEDAKMLRNNSERIVEIIHPNAHEKRQERGTFMLYTINGPKHLQHRVHVHASKTNEIL
jgi:hypothetical protein